ncbi:MAG: PfkB family carbohydrate kinase, partial [Verrucomicrobia bacterium]|nr:PfkB family carbohydrate kinase [Verrucomicrobiota bacterium]
MSPETVRDVVGRFSGATILVVGDLMLDRYVHGTVERISPEAPVPVVQVLRERALPGGAANVALNIRSLGGHAVMAGVVGADGAADALQAQLTAAGIGTSAIVTDAALRTTVKTRILADRQQIVRVDHDNVEPIPASTLEILNEQISRLIDGVDGVIIEDYGKGVITQSVIDVVVSRAEERGVPVALDPKDNPALTFSHLTLATPNFAEACAVAGMPHLRLTDDLTRSAVLARAAAALQVKWNCDLLVITLGQYGMYLSPRDGEPLIMPTQAREVFDVSGAGDTVIATLAGCLSAGL